jgi:hypothetical protein
MLSRLSRGLTALAALLLLSLYALPLWRIALLAPQYPEGIGMRIRLDTIEGIKEQDLANINALNHYIGMKAITPDAIPELRVMPWLVGGLVVLGLAAALVGRRRALVAWLAAFLALGVAGLADFYRWAWDYGHNLDPEAIIQVPGMSYTPPILGTKVLLNFTATSLPDAGAYAAGAAFALGLAALWLSRGASRAPDAAGAPARSALPAMPAGA